MAKFLDEVSSQAYIVEEIVPERAAIGFVGSTEALKSTGAIDLTGCVACGVPWHGRAVKQGAVLIIAGEGHGGLSARFRAWARHRKVKLRKAPIIVTKGGVRLLDEASVKGLAKRVAQRLAKLRQKLRLIIVDPVARSFAPGDENNANDMCRFIDNVDYLRRKFGCSAILVHHTGHGDKTRARGSSAFKAALDLEVVFVRRGLGVQLRCTKSKDAPPFADFQFELKEIKLGRSSDGTRPTSIVLIPAKRTLVSGSEPVKQMALITLLKQLATGGGTRRRDSSGNVRLAVAVKKWRDRAVKEELVPSEDSFDKLKRKLVKKKQIVVRDGFASVR